MTIDAACSPVPMPRIVRPSQTVATNSRNPVSVQVMLEGPQADLVELFAGDTRIGGSGPEFFYTFMWNTELVAEGAHQLTARATRMGMTRTSVPRTVVVDRTGPQLLSMTPEPGATVSQSTAFRLRFSEPVTAPVGNPWSAAVKLASTPTGAAAPTEIPSIISVGPEVTEVGVRARVPLPAGAVSLTWGGLVDAAGNSVTGVVSALFASGGAVTPNPPGTGGAVGAGWRLDGGLPVQRCPGRVGARGARRRGPARARGRAGAELLPQSRLVRVYTGPGGAAGPTGLTRRHSMALVPDSGALNRGHINDVRADDPAPAERRVFRYSAAGTTLTLNQTCPTQSTATVSYTTAGNKVILIDPVTSTVRTFVRRGTP